MAVDAQKFFNELLPAAMLKNPEYFKKIGVKCIFRITGDGGGEWYVNTSDSGQSVTQNDFGASDCIITTSAEDFQKLYENPDRNSLQLFFSGKLIKTGDQMAAMQIFKIFKFDN